MPLSEDEERILQEIAQQFYEDDPTFARLAETTLYRHAFRNIKWASVLFVVGLALLIATLSTSFLLAFGVGFVPMLASALIIERNARKMGRAGWEQATDSIKASGLRDYLGNTGKRVKDRFKREDE